MKLLKYALIFLAILIPQSVQSGQTADSGNFVRHELVGNWQRLDGEAKAIIYRCGQSFCARNTWVRNQRNTENTNDYIIISIKSEREQFLSGEAYAPQHGVKLAIEAHILENGLRTRGCIMGGLICKTWAWQRIPA